MSLPPFSLNPPCFFSALCSTFLPFLFSNFPFSLSIFLPSISHLALHFFPSLLSYLLSLLPPLPFSLTLLSFTTSSLDHPLLFGPFSLHLLYFPSYTFFFLFHIPYFPFLPSPFTPLTCAILPVWLPLLHSSPCSFAFFFWPSPPFSPPICPNPCSNLFARQLLLPSLLMLLPS